MVDNIEDWYMQGFEMSDFGVPAVGHKLAGSKDYIVFVRTGTSGQLRERGSGDFLICSERAVGMMGIAESLLLSI